jgi:hypothetical protein
MARMSGATWRPVPNCTKGGQDEVRGVVLHIMEGTLDGSDSWFRNASSQASAHFGVGKDGRIYQWVDTADRAWAQAAGNRTWLSIEHEGHSGDALTWAQLAATARIVAWAHATHGVPLQLADSVTGRGIGWHGMGGAAWGGHYDCPGNPIKGQRPAIITAAKSGTSSQEEDMPTADEIAQAVWSYQVDDPRTEGTKYEDAKALIWWAGADAAQANTTIKAQSAAIEALASKIGTGVDTAAVVTAVQQAIENAVVKVDVSVGDNTPQRES